MVDDGGTLFVNASSLTEDAMYRASVRSSRQSVHTNRGRLLSASATTTASNAGRLAEVPGA